MVCLAALIFAFTCSQAQSQTPEWTWVGGSSTIGNSGGSVGVYGTRGIPAPTNIPGSRTYATTATDANGNLWMFGGSGFDSVGGNRNLNDLWEFDTLSLQWVWVSGGSSVSNGSQGGVYGKLGTPAPGNVPGSRTAAMLWTDANGNLWMFGGGGYDSNNSFGLLNDLWEFSPTTKEWTWVGGSSTHGTNCLSGGCGMPGVYGILDTLAAGNQPGGREGAAYWTDSKGNFWLFGGEGFDSTGAEGALNDIWEFDLSTGYWAWMGGSSTVGSTDGQSGVYGKLGTPAPGNVPGGRVDVSSWVDGSGNFWLFGGSGFDSSGTLGNLNDLWEFSPSSGEWAWISGSNLANQPGVFGAVGDPATTNVPGSRNGAPGWADANGDFWLFSADLVDEFGGQGTLNDLWEFDPASVEWTWVGGNDSLPGYYSGEMKVFYTPPGQYGTLGVPAAANIPGGRSAAAGWTGTNGEFWMFGGLGADSTTPSPSNPQNLGYLNDLWVFGASQAPSPTFNLAAGTYTGIQTVKISNALPGATIFYTTDGTTPTTGSTRYSGSVTLNESVETLQAFATGPGYLPSAVASATYNLILPPAAKPVFTAGSGTYKSPQTVTISSSTPGAQIYYAINATPTTASTLYTGPITVAQPVTIEAIAVAPGHATSKEASAFYTIGSTSATLSVEEVREPDTFEMGCSVVGPQVPGKPGPTGTFTFIDATTGQTLGTATANFASSEPASQQLSSLVGQNPAALVAGDFNNDGIPDVAVVNAKDDTVSILLGNGDNTFQPQVVYQAGETPQAIVAGKFTSSGNLDLAVLNSGTNSVTIMLGNGNGTFTTATASSPVSGESLTYIVAGDFNNDGKQDLAVAGLNSSGKGTVSVLFGNGNGTFQAAKVTTLSFSISGILAGKFAGSGNLDLVVLGGETQFVLTLLAGNGDGTFQAQGIAASAQLSNDTEQIAAADLNGDGNLDLVAVGLEYNRSVGGLNGYSAELLGNGDGTFQFSPSLAQFLPPYLFSASGIAIVSVGGPTIWVANEAGKDIVALGNSTVVYPVNGSLAGLVAAQFDGSGNPEAFVTANTGGNDNTVSLIIPTSQESNSVERQDFTVLPGTIAEHNFQCTYSGDANYSPSASNLVPNDFGQAASPLFSLLVGDYPDAQPVQITDASYEATIYYTTDGSDPTTNSTVYTGPITLTSSTKLKAIAGGGYMPSLISEAVYTIAAAPQFSVVTGAIAPKFLTEVSQTSETVTMSDKTPGAVIYYTTDGTTPSIKSTRYTGAITLTKATTIKAFAVLRGLINSPIVAVTFNITQPAIPDIAWTVPRPITYGTPLSDIELDATASNLGTFTYSPRAGTVLDAGAHKLTVTFTPSDRTHYTTATKTIQIEVLKKVLVVAATHLIKVYGAAMPRLTYTLTGFVNGDTAAEAVKGKPVLATTATAKSVVDSYAITMTSGTLSSANYRFELSHGSIAVTRAELKVRVLNLVMTQGAAVPTLKYVIDGFVLGDTQSSATKGEPILTTTATSKSNPGYYPIDVTAGTLTAKNYSFLYSDGQLTVVP